MSEEINHNRIKLLLEAFIKHQEGDGSASGGSGHSSQISTSLVDDYEVIKEKNRFKLIFKFCKSIETEFTYYPDNPPIEDVYSQVVYIDNYYNIIGFEKKQFISSSYTIDFPSNDD